LIATIPAGDLTAAGTFNITVFTPAPGGGTSNAQTFTVNLAPTPTPTPLPGISISPPQGPVGTSVTVMGFNFGASTSVSIDIAGSSLGSTTTNPSGSFSKAATIPSLSTGLKLVTATDGSRTATCTFNVIETVTPTPTPTPAPTLPCRFNGTVMLNGANVADGIIVTATIEGDEYSTTTSSAYGNSRYSIQISEPSGKSYPGNTVTFAIGGNTAQETGTWQRGANILLNLTVSTIQLTPSPTPTHTPTPTPTPLTPTPTPTVTPTPVNLQGDCDVDEDIDIVDALIALKMSTGKIEVNLVADMNDDGQVTSLDAAKIMKTALKRYGVWDANRKVYLYPENWLTPEPRDY